MNADQTAWMDCWSYSSLFIYHIYSKALLMSTHNISFHGQISGYACCLQLCPWPNIFPATFSCMIQAFCQCIWDTYISHDHADPGNNPLKGGEKKNPSWASPCRIGESHPQVRNLNQGLAKPRPWPRLRFPCPAWTLMMDSYILTVYLTYSTDEALWGTSNEYPQHMFSWTNEKNIYLDMPIVWHFCLFVLWFYGPVNPMGSYRVWSVYLTTLLLGRFSPLSS